MNPEKPEPEPAGPRVERHFKVHELAEMYKVSRTTIKQAVAERRMGARRGRARNSPLKIPESEAVRWWNEETKYYPPILKPGA